MAFRSITVGAALVIGSATGCGSSIVVDEVPSLREHRVEQALVDRALVAAPTPDAPRARELLLAQIGQERRLEARLGHALAVSTVRWS